ncbi:hypothetical protein [Tenacibaculum sp. 190524A02b]|uniref:hypothetical protein n=1 Tax=Tenacibaculum vairaonense TaxID=3137860 RepID=UPI0031FAE3FD
MLFKTKGFFLAYILSCFFTTTFLAQNYDFVNEDNAKSYEEMSFEQKNITIPLYNVEIDGVSIPVLLSYDNRGKKVSDVPNSVGYNWELKAGGEVDVQVNHLIDDSKKGWFHNKEYNQYRSGYDTSYKGVFVSEDLTPDVYRMRMSNGDYLDYLYDVSFDDGEPSLIPVYLKANEPYLNVASGIGVYLGREYRDENDYDLRVFKSNGTNYFFRKGLKRELPVDLKRYSTSKYYDNDSLVYTNYYIHNIYSDNNTDYIKFKYKDTYLKKFILHAKATRTQISGERPLEHDPIETVGYYEDISVEDVSRKEISQIVTKKEVVEFVYKKAMYDNNLSSMTQPNNFKGNLEQQEFNLLDKINIYDHSGNFVFGYKFHYSEMTQDQNDFEGLFRLKKIDKVGKNKISSYTYKKFTYYKNVYGDTQVTSRARDVFGYPNGQEINNGFDYYLNYGQRNLGDFVDRKPYLEYMVKGMLQSIENTNGGKKEFVYQINKHSDMYYGGLLVNKVKLYDSNNTLAKESRFFYEDPEGFGLPMFDETVHPAGTIPTDVYSEGYYEEDVMHTAWLTYFTSLDPQYKEDQTKTLRYNLTDSPKKLMRYTPFTDALIQSLGIVNFPQLESGSFYRKVTNKKVNVHSNTYEKGEVVRHYKPSISGFSLDKKLEKTEYINNEGKKIKEVINNYIVKNLKEIKTHRFRNVHLHGNTSRPDLYRYVINEFPIYNIIDVLKSVEFKEYANTGVLTKTKKTEFEYVNEESTQVVFNDFLNIKTEIDYINNEALNKRKHIYFSEIFSNKESELYWLFNKNPLVEQSNWIKIGSNWKLNNAIVYDYSKEFRVTKMGYITNNPTTNQYYNEADYVHPYYDTADNLITLIGDEFLEYEYDEEGKVIVEKNNKTNTNTFYQRSNEYNSLYVDATLSVKNNSLSSSDKVFLKKSFENTNDFQVVKFGKAFSGEYVFQGNSINLGTYPNNCVISFWSYANNKWTYNRATHSGGDVIVNKPNTATYIDEIRIQPQHSILNALTFKPLIGKTSTLNNRGEGNRLQFNVFGELLYSLDKNGNVIQEGRKNRILK